MALITSYLMPSLAVLQPQIRLMQAHSAVELLEVMQLHGSDPATGRPPPPKMRCHRNSLGVSHHRPPFLFFGGARQCTTYKCMRRAAPPCTFLTAALGCCLIRSKRIAGISREVLMAYYPPEPPPPGVCVCVCVRVCLSCCVCVCGCVYVGK